MVHQEVAEGPQIREPRGHGWIPLRLCMGWSHISGVVCVWGLRCFDGSAFSEATSDVPHATCPLQLAGVIVPSELLPTPPPAGMFAVARVLTKGVRETTVRAVVDLSLA